MFESYEVGTRCWLPDASAGWVGALVTEKRVDTSSAPPKCILTFRLDDADDDAKLVERVIDSEPSPEVPLRNPEHLETTEDLVTLSHMNEPSVLHSIRRRYEQLNIYTFSGIVLIATNPFAKIDNLYTNEIVQMYSGKQRGELEPHLFSIAEDAYRCMTRDLKSQTIVVSGESGAGKTVSAKYIMRYFASVESPSQEGKRRITSATEELSDVEREILATNPIMEAFGNAKTSRNDNSSRFGKYLEIRFDNRHEISGARIRTYLLERSRIVFHPNTERNYHIFYQMLKGLTSEELTSFGLESGIESFKYVNQGSPAIEGVNDGKDFNETRGALEVVGISPQVQSQIWQVLAALLHLGNITIKATRSATIINSDDSHLKFTSELLGIDPLLLAKWLTKRQITMRSEKIMSDLDLKGATTVRDSVAKYIYSALFDWLVAAVNKKLLPATDVDQLFIGVLDIYGFEHFQRNSFEQFCINYANEKLQQEFNQHVFKLEQEEYAAEEIDWTYIDFVDNQPCIALIENKLGILGLLDEESRLPSGTDEGFANKMYSSLEKNSHFRKARLGQTAFVVSHYAHDVQYETDGFLEKNRDTVPDQVIEVLEDTNNQFLKDVLSSVKHADASPAAVTAAAGARGKARKPTLGNIFKTSLQELMATINMTNAHYIRCIKPNEQKAAWVFDGPMVLSQLRACGVLETIRISSAGFPGRWPYEEFAQRYDLLLHSSKRADPDARSLSKSILEAAGKRAEDQFQLGKTKVFLRAGMLAYLENLRSSRQKSAATSIQKVIRMRVARDNFNAVQSLISVLQRGSRGLIARKRAQSLRETKSAQKLQGIHRGRVSRKSYEATIGSIVGLQRVIRGKWARERALAEQQSDAAVQIQSLLRRHMAVRTHKRQVRSITKVQSMVRRRGAVRELNKLREEKHSVKGYEERQFRMENKVIELQDQLRLHREELKASGERIQAANTALTAAQESHAEEIARLNGEHGSLLEKHEQLQGAHAQVSKDLEDSQAALVSRDEELQSFQKVKAELEQEAQELRARNAELQQQIQSLEHQLHQASTAGIGSASVMDYHRQQHQAATVAGQRQAYYEHQQPSQQSRNAALGAVEDEEDGTAASEINREIEQMLMQSPGPREELLSKIIRSLEVPTPKAHDSYAARDVLFPANLINLMISEMWRLGYIVESEKFIGATTRTIQETVQKATGERTIPVGAFWMSNVHEIYSFLSLAEANIVQSPSLRQEMSVQELEQYEQLIALAKKDTESVMFNVYHISMKEIRKIVDKMIIPCVVEEQSIPGFQQEEQPRFLQRMFSSTPPPKMDELITLLTKIYTCFKAFHLEDNYVRQPLLEILNMIGAKAFNDMMMRKNFLTWKRAVQINYNVTRLDEWCKGHGLPEGGLPLERITQSAKLLQLKKNYEQDVSIIYDICWSLSPAQIQRLISNYHASDYEPPVSSKIHNMIAKRVREDTAHSTELLLEVRPLSDSGPFEMVAPRLLEKIEPYVPMALVVPKVRALAEATTKFSLIVESRVPDGDEIPSSIPVHEDMTVHETQVAAE